MAMKTQEMVDCTDRGDINIGYLWTQIQLEEDYQDGLGLSRSSRCDHET